MNLRCDGISKIYGSVIAISNADLSVKKGEVRAILGGNGSGKSTLAKILGGAVKPNAGNIEVYGRPYTVQSPSEAKKNGVVITSQELSLFMNLTVEENLCICNIPVSGSIFTDKKAIKEKALYILKKLGLEEILYKSIASLPANEQYLIEFAKALVQEPQILIIDEITSALYRKDVEVVKKIINELKEKGCSILFISHRMPEIYSICDSVTVMKNGETIGTFRIDEKDENELLSLMTGRNICSNQHKVQEIEIQEADKREIVISINDIELPQFHSKIDLELKEGDIIGIAGLQGHGQSDLVRKLFGMEGPVDLSVHGKQRHIASPYQAVKAGFAFISGNREQEGTFRERSVSENLRAVSNLVLKKEKVDELKLLKDYGVKFDTPKQQITALSGGNQQKVVIGRWTSTLPKLLLADDPTKGIDVQARRDVHQIMRQLAESGSVVIMVSSDDEELVELTQITKYSKVIVMYEGKIVRVLTGADITEENIAAASMPIEKECSA
ncbi:sugar ABC transporter ATP-binding protein [Petroclostridium sp. X23]|uniref:sugar ABC transporter ATP-binding protein n=1 Tax=Petroclostridium sp. X23 TaxID=3045146 RepID=UPI0024AD4B25|nr:sugar ABC transporter ATP-binding protein [Petroclostridium sp. X23]WHH59039.1 sugar ABC transporter ATP-binding protein [Petroclostridium sp. X23]